MDSKSDKKLFWLILLTEAILVLIIIVAVFARFPSARKQVAVWYCDSRFGFCEDTTTEKSVKTNAQGKIVERIEITKNQPGKTLWDLLELAGTLAIPVLLAILSYQFQRRDQLRAEQQAEAESKIAAANLRDEALQAYLDRMAELLLNPASRKDLLPSEIEDLSSDNSVRDVARIRTVTILRRLEGDTEQQARVISFLADAQILNFLLRNATLEKANLEKANLRGVNLEGVDLKGAKLKGANLREGYLKGADLKGADLEKADLTQAILYEAHLEEAKLGGAILTRANLEKADLTGADLTGAYLYLADLREIKCDMTVGAYSSDESWRDDQIKKARGWESAYYSPNLRERLGLPPRPSEANKDKP